jgi:hypothetical protein
VWSETRRYDPRDTTWPGSNTLTFLIVGFVVLINSVAWGIPLLTNAHTATEESTSIPATGGAIPRPSRVGMDLPSRGAPVPLPAMAPNGHPESAPAARNISSEHVNWAPKTLYPQPERAPEQLLGPPNEIVAAAPDAAPARGLDVRPRNPDLAFASPYAPGVRIQPRTGSQGSGVTPPQSSYEHDRDSTLARAREIAQRASRRFEAMRARLEERETSSPHETDATVLPLDARRQTASLIGSGRAAKSAVASVRPNLIHQPISRAQEVASIEVSSSPPPKPSASAPSAAGPEAAIADPRPLAATPVTVPIPTVHRRPDPPSQIATAQEPPRGPVESEPVARTDGTTGAGETKPAGQKPKVASSSRTAEVANGRAERRRRAAQRRQNTTRRPTQQASRRRQQKIDGFGKNFHRQLVSANFFSNQR